MASCLTCDRRCKSGVLCAGNAPLHSALARVQNTGLSFVAVVDVVLFEAGMRDWWMTSCCLPGVQSMAVSLPMEASPNSER